MLPLPDVVDGSLAVVGGRQQSRNMQSVTELSLHPKSLNIGLHFDCSGSIQVSIQKKVAMSSHGWQLRCLTEAIMIDVYSVVHDAE